jgi:acyl carrier protein
MARSGVLGLSEFDGLTLFDLAVGARLPALVPARLDLSALRSEPGGVPPMLRGLVRGGVRSRAAAAATGPAPSWSALATLGERERDHALLELVCATATMVLGRDRTDLIDPETGFLDLGFDSLTAIELRNRLEAISGRHLPATLVFDYPSAAAVAERLRSEVVTPAALDAGAPLDERLTALEAELAVAAPDEAEHTRIGERLRSIAAAWANGRPGDDDIGAATVEELLGILDDELESSG